MSSTVPLRDGLLVGRGRLVPRDAIRSVRVVVRLNGTARLSIDTAAGEQRAEFASVAHAVAVLHALELAPEQHGRPRIAFGVRRAAVAGLFPVWCSMWVSWLALSTHTHGSTALEVFRVVMGAFTVLAPALATVVAARTLRHLELGTDGVRVSSARWRRSVGRFVAYSRMAGVRVDGSAVHLHLAEGDALPLHFGTSAVAQFVADWIARTRGAAAASREPGGRAWDALADAAGSVEGLRALADGSPDRYRERSTTKSELHAALHAPAAPRHVRIAAAAALKASDGSAVDAALRRAARESADPEVERGLVRIASAESDEAIGEALAADARS